MTTRLSGRRRSSRLRAYWLFFAVLLLVPGASHSTTSIPLLKSNKDSAIWEGQSGGFTIKWSTSDLTITRIDDPKDTVFSARAKAIRQSGYRPGKPWGFMYYYWQYDVLSVVGSLVSIKETEVYANPGSYVTDRLLVLDLQNPHRKAKLSDWFDDKDLLKALLADPIVNEEIKSIGKPRRPFSSSRALFKYLAASNSGSDIWICEDMFSSFCFHHIEGGNVAVRVAAADHPGMRNDSYEQLGLILPIPDSLKPSFERADNRSEGFLMKDNRQISGRRITTVYVGPQIP